MKTKSHTQNNLKSILDRFSLQAKKLRQYKKQFSKSQLKLDAKVNGLIKNNLEYITEEEIAYSLDIFRAFYLKSNNDLNFARVCNEILREPSLAKFHEETKKFLDMWNFLLDKNPKKKEGINVKINDEQITSSIAFDHWLNEGYKHQEQYKPNSDKGLDRLASFPLALNFSKMLFIDAFQKFCIVVVNFNLHVVEKILNDNHEN